MTARRLLALACDEPGCHASGPAGLTVEECRTAAAYIEPPWAIAVVRRVQDPADRTLVDYCPEHAPARLLNLSRQFEAQRQRREGVGIASTGAETAQGSQNAQHAEGNTTQADIERGKLTALEAEMLTEALHTKVDLELLATTDHHGQHLQGCRACYDYVQSPLTALCDDLYQGIRGRDVRCDRPAGHTGPHSNYEGRERAMWPQRDPADDPAHQPCQSVRDFGGHIAYCARPAGHPGSHWSNPGRSWMP